MKKLLLLLCAAIMSVPTMVGQNDHSTTVNTDKNQMVLTTTDNVTKYYNTEDITSVELGNGNVVVRQAAGDDTYEGNVNSICFAKAQGGTVGKVRR